MNKQRLYHRQFRFEQLENRVVLSANPFIDFSQFDAVDNAADIMAGKTAMTDAIAALSLPAPQMFLTTTGDPANYVTSAGTELDGVVDIIVSFPNGAARGSGTLLPTGNQILTAAHIFFDPNNGDPAVGATVYYDTPGGVSSSNTFAPVIHPSYNGNVFDGNDLAVIQTASVAPSGVSRFDIYRGSDEVGQEIVKAGYGKSGTGNQGSVLVSGTKRNGENRYDALGEALNGTLYDLGTMASGLQLVFDFDNGISTNDASGVVLGISNLGEGQDEVSSAPGDSGGPSLIDGYIAGITSFGQGLSISPDVLPGTNSSFGEFAIDTRVSAYAPWIDSLIDVAGFPTITDVRLDGSGISPHSFAALVQTGEQLRPIASGGVTTLEIEFSEHVLFDADDLDLVQTIRLSGGSASTSSLGHTGFNYDTGTHIATWTFNTLADGKYAIHLPNSVTDAAGHRLDADWSNETADTPDNYTDDPSQSFAIDMANGTEGTEGGEFRFHFALLAGDYNGDGVVDNDPTNYLPVREIGGADLNDDEIVDVEDLIIWQNGFGTYGGSGVAGDIDGDGDADGSDFLLWQLAYGNSSAWYEGPQFAGQGGTMVQYQVGIAPQVMNVTISGSLSLHDPFSFDTVDGSGEQLRTVPVGGADTISITFSELVNISANSLGVVGLQTANIPVLADFQYDTMTMTATWRFESWALGDQYLFSLADSVADVDGDLLDGEWVNPASLFTTNTAVSQFPSGDGTAGGHFNFVATLLAGDANLDGLVNVSDLSILSANFNLLFDQTFENADFNGDGAVNMLDLGYLSYNWGRNLQDIWILADLDGDNIVDDDDLLLIQDNIGLTGATYEDGDLNGDGVVDIEDVDLAFAQFGLGLDMVA